MATYYLTMVTERNKRRFRIAAKACSAMFASRGARAVLRGDLRCVALRAGALPSVHHMDRDSFSNAKKAWL